MSESSEDVAIAAVIAEAWCQWQEREGFERGEPIINQFGAALEALDALRSLPVEERAKAVGLDSWEGLRER